MQNGHGWNWFRKNHAGMIGDRLLRCHQTLASPASLALHPTEGTGQVQEAIELA
ncbi:MAG: hypothetical protein HF981_11075 [Desulfobacteraceae bacterium]|nr:hypothetical protein [Desulfobacteraceae bacterium]MBC2750916.1 hypothetical protein [Desulfobacteraceae bacterium]